jgi:OmpA-OmpF porin, OOP family
MIRNSLLFLLVLFISVVKAQESTSGKIVIRSAFDEHSPVLTPDGQTLYFTMANHPQNMGGIKDPGDIWFSRLGEDQQWSTPIHAGKTINDRSYNAVGGFSHDGKKIYLLSHYDHGNVAKTQGISVATLQHEEWGTPVNISIPYFRNKSTVLSGYISRDESIFVFSAETYGSKGVEDIYVSIKNGDRWSEPKNLGAVINTQFQELSPSLSNDGKTLYYSSNGLKGSGSFDVFSATRIDDSWTNWSVPTNIGSNINSDGRELFYRTFTHQGKILYTSTKSSDGYGDIKMMNINIEKDTATVKDIVAVNLSPDSSANKLDSIRSTTPQENIIPNTIKVFGKVTNAKTGEVVSAHISFSSPSIDKETESNSTQGFSFALPTEQRYTIKIDAKGYISTIENLNVQSYQMPALEMNFKLQPIEVGTTVNLKSVLFAQSTTNLLPESFPELDVVAAFMRANPEVVIELAGHTDNRGVHAHNVKLSQARVNKVKEYLISKGIDKKRITGKGYGGVKPIANNDSEESRKLNRRVEFIILKM